MTGTLERIRKPVHNKCYGIEIECKVNERPDRHGGFDRFFYLGFDCSINTSYRELGIEFVSQPLPFAWLCKEVKKLGKKYKWSVDGSCGIHVHVSRSCVSMKRIEELNSFFRTVHRLRAEKLFGREWNGYCDPFDDAYSRYRPINTTNEHTVEFRMFRSGDADWAIECLRRTKLMVEYKGELSFEKLMNLFGL